MNGNKKEAKQLSIDEIGARKFPRLGHNFDRPGSYQLATIISSNVVDPDGMLCFEHFITGYGDINDSKITGYISSEIFDERSSTVSHSLNKVGNEIKFGAATHPIDPAGVFCTISGMKGREWNRDTLYFDMENSALPFVATEKRIGSDNSAPFSYKLKLNKSVKAGDYSLDFYFTYFNGDKWQCSKESVRFKVRTIFERHALFFSGLAVCATIVGVLNILLRFFVHAS